MSEAHVCNAYCRAPEHCEVLYCGPAKNQKGEVFPDFLTDEQWHALATDRMRRDGYTVTRIENAREPEEQFHRGGYQFALLVWFTAGEPIGSR